LRDGQVHTYTLDPQTLGFKPAVTADLLGGDPQHNAEIAYGILDRKVDSGKRDVVLLNAAAGLVASGKASDLEQGIAIAAESIDSGAALAKLNALITHSQKFAQAG
jgi:anthranilate phosphoribosyltransferase